MQLSSLDTPLSRILLQAYRWSVVETIPESWDGFAQVEHAFRLCHAVLDLHFSH
jgi:hypothetical protein